ncbi:MAG: undecaprenyl-diphosphate phosphatase [Candidatus Marinimicrobia bacterium]|nr:undecaprenyl-diphosphate phosphatase [Candidatus Neomarinimicrobiota bacterium]
MNIVDIVILGILQGITEFLPVSSSGHLVLAQYLLGIESPGNTLEVLFHIGTLFSVFYVFNKDIKSIVISLNEKPTQKLVIYIIIATIPAVIIGLIFKSHIINLFSSIVPVGYALLSTGVILTLSINFKNENKSLSYLYSLFIGLAQAIAIIPGISRSGTTISISMLLGIPPKEAARFSFLISIPVIIGAGLLGFLELESYGLLTPKFIITGILTSFIVGTLSLKVLLKILEIGRFHFFGIYCIIAGIVAVLS